MLTIRQIATSALLGLAGFWGSLYSWQFEFENFTLSFVWSYVLPLMAALAYGPWGGLIAGILGLGAFIPILLWSNNGWAAVVTSLLLQIWYLIHGFGSNRFKKNGHWLFHPFALQVLYAVLFGLGVYFFFPIAFSLNPPFWMPSAFTAISPEVTVAIISKDIPLMFLTLVIATALLLLAPIRKLLAIDSRPYSQKNTLITVLSLSSAYLFWIILQILVAIHIDKQTNLNSLWIPSTPYSALALLVLMFFGLTVAYAISLFSEQQISGYERLQQSESRLNLVLSNVDAYIFIKDKNGKYTYVSPKVASLFQLSADEIIGKDDSFFFNEASVDEIQKSDLQVLQHGIRVERKEHNLEAAGVMPRTFWAIKVPILNAMGEITGLCGVSTDITLQERESKEREVLLAQLQIKNRALQNFTYTASHDLRTPIVNICGYVKELREDLKSGNMDDVDKDLQYIDCSATHIGNLIRDLLELTRARKSNENPKEFNLNALVQEVLAEFSFQLSQIDSNIVIAPDMPVLFAERGRIFQVLQNFIDNAIKYRKPDGLLEITIGAEIKDSQTICWVKDNGIGIPKQYQHKIFGLFEKLINSPEGTGIGLAISQTHIESQGGNIWVESEGSGQGTVFFFSLPAKRVN